MSSTWRYWDSKATPKPNNEKKKTDEILNSNKHYHNESITDMWTICHFLREQELGRWRKPTKKGPWTFFFERVLVGTISY